MKFVQKKSAKTGSLNTKKRKVLGVIVSVCALFKTNTQHARELSNYAVDLLTPKRSRVCEVISCNTLEYTHSAVYTVHTHYIIYTVLPQDIFVRTFRSECATRAQLCIPIRDGRVCLCICGVMAQCKHTYARHAVDDDGVLVCTL